jgi:hypothetical protein
MLDILYLLAVKENQPPLTEALREFLDEGKTRDYGRQPVSRREMAEKDHGRIETRRALWIGDLFWMDAPLRARWPKLSGVGMLERTREIKGKISRERAYFIGGKGIIRVETFAAAARRQLGDRKRPALGARCHLPRGRLSGSQETCLAELLRLLANSRWRCCAGMRLTQNAAFAPGEKPSSVSRIIALPCSDSSRKGKCDCPAPAGASLPRGKDIGGRRWRQYMATGAGRDSMATSLRNFYFGCRIFMALVVKKN